jgi:hypothetical protein
VSALTVGPPTREMPIPAPAGLDAYGYGRARAEQRQHAARLRELAAIDDTHAAVAGLTLAALRREEQLAERLFWGRVRTLTLAVAVDRERLTLTSTIGGDTTPVIAAVLDELALYSRELDAQPYRRDVALQALDQTWVTGRRAYLTEAAA